MSWLKSSFTQYAQDALSQAQASIDRALEIEPEQDPLTGPSSSRPTIKPRTPPVRRRHDQKPSTLRPGAPGDENWAAWGATTVNNLWESSFTTPPPDTGLDGRSSPRKKSNALKLGQRSTRRSSDRRSDKDSNINKTKTPVKDSSSEHQKPPPTYTEDIMSASTVLVEKPVQLTDDAPSSDSLTDVDLTFSPKVKEPPTPSLSTCSSSSALSQSTMIKSSSSGGSEQSVCVSVCTITNDQQLITDVVDEVTEECISPERGGWSEDEIDKVESEGSSCEPTERQRCPSIGSTASSSILMLQSPYDTTESNGDRSDEKSDEDSLRTPTNLPVPKLEPKLDLAHQTITEEVPVPLPAHVRAITSPTHSEQSDLIVIAEDSTPTSSEIMKLKEVLHAREQRLFKMNQEYVHIQDDLHAERSRGYNLEQNLSILTQKHTLVVERLQEELGAMEDLKDHIEGELQSLKDLGDIGELKRELDDKEQLIEELTMEGEKLAHSSFNNSNHVKKLRQKEKEDEKVIKEQTNKIDCLRDEAEVFKTKLKEKEAKISENEQNISDLNSILKSRSEELSNVNLKLDSCESENMALKAKIECCMIEVNTLKERNAEAECRANQETLSANIKAKEQAQTAVEELRVSTSSTIRQLTSQIGEQEEVIARLEQQAAWREQRQRDQIQELHTRVEDADGRNQDLSSSITASTQPLLRQIQLYKESLANQQSNWEKIENELKDKLDSARLDLSNSEMEKREMSDKLQVTKTKVTTLQTQLDSLRSERNNLEVNMEVTQNKLQILEEERRKDTNKADSVKAQFVQSLEDSRTECDQLKEDLCKLQSYVRDLESSKSVLSEVEDIASRSSTPPIEFTSQTNILERSLFGTSTPVSHSTPTHNSFAMEKLTSNLRQSQSEILSYQEQVRSLSLSKSSLSAEITVLSQKCDELEQKILDLPKVRKENKELQTRYSTLLQMYGEKAEEVQELNLDLTDVRNAYKAQIEQLLSKVIR